MALTWHNLYGCEAVRHKLKNSLKTNIENWWSWKMRYHLFLQYGWFLQNLEKDFIRTHMNTTVITAVIDL